MDCARLILYGCIGFFSKPSLKATSISNDINDSTFEGHIVLLGDSLIYITYNAYDLKTKIDDTTKYKYNFNYINLSQNGNTINDLRKRFEEFIADIEKVPIEKRSKIIILMFWDSDVSDTSLDNYKKNKGSIEQKYINDLTFILNKCNELKIRISVAGPGLLGNVNKTKLLEDFCGINKFVCAKNKCEYLHIREEFLKEEKEGKTVTIDGEHLNEEGAKILGKMFASAIDNWKKDTETYDTIKPFLLTRGG